MTLRSPLARVLGRGSAGHGSREWLVQRVTSVALVPLTLWLLFSLLALPALDRDIVIGWIAGGSHSVWLALLVLTAAWHSQLGLRVIVEDYVHSPGIKALTLIALAFAHVLLAFAGVAAIIRIALGLAA
jgi:succinate dehydrogenase / fumarate reductase membrane anchor subunit